MSVGVPFNKRNKKVVDFDSATGLDQGVEFFFKVVTLLPAASATPVPILPDAQVGPGRTPYIIGYAFHVNGATPWSGGTGTKVALQDTAGVEIMSIATAALTANNVIETKVANVTYSANFQATRQGTLALGLQFRSDNNYGAGSPIVLMVYGILGS